MKCLNKDCQTFDDIEWEDNLDKCPMCNTSFIKIQKQLFIKTLKEDDFKGEDLLLSDYYEIQDKDINKTTHDEIVVKRTIERITNKKQELPVSNRIRDIGKFIEEGHKNIRDVPLTPVKSVITLPENEVKTDMNIQKKDDKVSFFKNLDRTKIIVIILMVTIVILIIVSFYMLINGNPSQQRVITNITG